MAKVTKVVLSIPDKDHENEDLLPLKVNYAVDFSPEEIGKKFKVVFEIWPKGEGPRSLSGPLHTFRFGNWNLKRPYKIVTAEANFSAEADTWVVRDRLDYNEDKPISADDYSHVPGLNPDYVYARVVVFHEAVGTSTSVGLLA